MLLLHHTVVQSGFDVMGVIDWLISHINIYGKALAIDEAFRHLDEAHQYLLDGEKMQGSAPHTDVLKAAIHSTKLAKSWLKFATMGFVASLEQFINLRTARMIMFGGASAVFLYKATPFMYRWEMLPTFLVKTEAYKAREAMIAFDNMKGIVYAPYDKGGLEGPPTKIPDTSVGMMKMVGLLWLIWLTLLFTALRAEEAEEPEWASKLWTGSIEHYPSTKEANSMLEQFMEKCSDIIRKVDIGESVEHRRIYAYVITRNDTPVSVVKPRLMVTSLMHSREPGGLAISLYTVGRLCDDYKAADPRTVYLINTREVWVVPIVNPDGYIAVEDPKLRDVRKNRRDTCPNKPEKSGVDLNRNFGYKWSGHYGKCSEEYAGTEPFSEPETQALKKMVEDRQFHIALNFHSYGSMLTYPYNYAKTGKAPLPVDDEAAFQELAEVFEFERYGPADKLLGYTATGESDDWFYGVHGIMSMSPEIGSESGGFYSPPKEIPGIVHRNYRRIRHALHKAGLEIRRVTCSSESDGNMQINLKNAGLGASFGEYAAVAMEGCGPTPATGKIKQISRRSEAQFQISCPAEASGGNHDHKICLIENIPEGTTPPICRCAVTSAGKTSKRAEWTTPDEDATCQAAVRSLKDPTADILDTTGSSENLPSKPEMQRWVIVSGILVIVACLWLLTYTLWCAGAQQLRMKTSTQGRYANLEIGDYDLESAARRGAGLDDREESFGMNLRERRKPTSASPSEEELDEVIAKLEKEEDGLAEEEQRNRVRPPRRAKDNCRRTIDLSTSEASGSNPSPSVEEEEESEDESEGPDLEGGSIVARTMKDDELWLLIKPKDEAWNKVLWAPYQVCCEEDSAYKQRYASFKRKHRESEGMHAVDFVACKKERSSSGDGSVHPTTGRPSRASLAGASVIDMPQKELLEVLVDREIINEEWLVPDHLLTFSKVEGSRIWLVQWGGLPVSEATWEDESPTDTPQELIEEWEKLNDPSRKRRWQEIADRYLASHQDCDDDVKTRKRRGRPPKHKKQKAIPLQEIRRPKDIAESWVAETLCSVGSYTPTPTPGGEELKSEEKANGEMEDSDEMVYLPTKDTLFGFQVEGIKWLLHNWSQYRGCILADEMGMGKTVQTAVFLSAVMGTVGGTGPSLIIAPLSTLQHWQRELQKWAPELKVVVMAGSSEDRDMIADFDMSWINPNTGHREKEPMKHRAEPEFCPKFDVVVTSYEIFLACSSRSGLTSLTNYDWRVVVLDEGHRVKNHLSHSTKALTHIVNVQHTVILTGTPIQNNLKELWSILHLVDKKRFPTYEEVEAELRKDDTEEEGRSTEGTPSLEQDKKSEHDSAAANLDLDKVTEVLRPYMLRRYKSDAMKKVPPKLEHIIEVEFTTLQRKVYKSVYDKKIYGLVRGKGGKSMLNNIAMELRKCCAHPYLITGVEESHLEALGVEPDSNIAMQNLTEMSGKFVFLEKLIPQLRERGEKLLIFSQFKIVLDIIEDWLIWKKLPVERLDGSVSGPKRQAAIDRFNDKKHDSFAFLLTTRAGGVGINLTSASVVVIYDSDWNPQNDNQAQARCHRIGQTKTVRVYRLLTRDSYEQKLFEIASKKLGLEQAIMSSVTANSDLNLSKKELESLIKEGAYAAFKDNSSREEEFRNASLDDIMSSDRIKTVTYGTMVSGGHRSRFSKAYFSANPETPKTEETVSSPESVESGGGEGADSNLSDAEFWSKLVADKSLLTTDPDAKEEMESMDVGTRSTRKTRYAGNFLRFRTARTEKGDRLDQEYEPAESVSEFGESDLDDEDLVDEEESLSKASRGTRKKRGKRKTKNEVDAQQNGPATASSASANESVRPQKRPRVDISSASPALQRAAAAAAAAQKAKAAAAKAAASGAAGRPPSPGMSYPYMAQHHHHPAAASFPLMRVSSATYPYIPPPPRFPYSAVQYRGMPMPPGSIGSSMPNSRMLFPPPAMYQSSTNYGMMYGMYVASRAAAASGERHHRREPPVNPEDLIGSIDSNNIERLD
ncbi:choline dehydrogenase 7 [Perkinsus chesapeaki]|uniref:Choline dehydrogenase 7 n=1 Tax=Perkinsus chesapeaki TaxID=330153 RepID=A0A7J6MDV0_PERCH|nr:choline dehydrogenase 7 [Perkinsus chesapeaki]